MPETIDSSPRRLYFDLRWNYWLDSLSNRVPEVCLSTDAEVPVDSNPRRLSVDQSWNYLAQVTVVCPLTDAETVDSHLNRLSFNRYNH